MEGLMHEPGVFPPGECYEAAFVTLMREVKIDLHTANGWKLVHGILHDVKGTYGHAWVEKGDTVYDPIEKKFIYKDVYYQANNVELAIPYTHIEPLHLSKVKDTFGYWDDRLAVVDHLLRPSPGSKQPETGE